MTTLGNEAYRKRISLGKRTSRNHIFEVTGIPLRILTDFEKQRNVPVKAQTIDALCQYFFDEFRRIDGFPASISKDAEQCMRWIVAELVVVYPEDQRFWPKDPNKAASLRASMEGTRYRLSDLWEQQRKSK